MSNKTITVGAAFGVLIGSLAIRLILLAVGAFIILINIQDIQTVGFNFWNVFWIVFSLFMFVSRPRASTTTTTS